MIPLTMLDDAARSTGAATVATTPEIDALLTANEPVAIGVSGGKDSCAVAFATIAHLNKIGHTGPRLLIHADLGVTEWCDSLPTCERLAKALGLELVVVRRKQGDMMERWEQRWRDNLERWVKLLCVKIILPWSTPSMRFCTSELKIDQITRYLCGRFPGRRIVNVTGIRAQESTERAKSPVSSEQAKLESKTHETTGVNWNAILPWSIGNVWACMESQGFTPHEAYTVYGASRVSCVWCILATEDDHRAGARDDRNHALGRRMVALETVSTFGFQGNRWLGDTLANLLTGEQRTALEETKSRAVRREEAESRIPAHLLYTKDWPTCVPTQDEAQLLGEVRAEVAAALGIPATFTDPAEIVAQYTALMAEKARRDAEKEAKAKRKAEREAKSAV